MFAVLLLMSYFLVVLGFFVIGLLVSLRQKTALHRTFAAFCFLLGSWQLLQFISQIVSDNHNLAVSFLRLSISMSAITATTFLHFTFTYAGKKFRAGMIYPIGVMAGALSIPSTGLQTISITHTGIGVPKLDIWYAVLLLYAGVCIATGVASIAFHYKRASGQKQRSQDRILLVSSLVVGLTVVMASFYTSTLSQSAIAQHVVPLACLGAVISFGYVIVYRGLFDIHFLVIRAAAYITTLFMTTLLLVTPVVLIFDHALRLSFSRPTFVAVVVFGTAALYLIQYLRRLFDDMVGNIFFRHYYDPQDVLDKLSDILVGHVDMEELKTLSGQLLSDALKPQFLQYMVLKTAHKTEQDLLRLLLATGQNVVVTDELSAKEQVALTRMLRSKDITIAIKLRTTHEDIGFLVLGYKQSGEVYTLRDKRLLSIAADEVAIGLQNALRFQEIQRFNATLQEKVDDATRNLRRVNDKLRKLNETKDDFISMASHQLRTPLTSVKGYVSMVLDGDAGKITSLQRKLLTQSFISSQRMVYLISDLLNVSRLKTGKFVIEPVPCNLAKVIQEEIEQLVETVKGRHLTLAYHKPEHFPTLLLDETKLRQVIMNFIDNAVYYTPSGGHITVNLVDKPQSIEFTVVDDGIGVPRHEQHHLFTKFFRAPNAKRARPDGTGLGLFMAKKVIVAQGGAVIFHSKENHGGTFGFTFAKAPITPSSAQPKTS